MISDPVLRQICDEVNDTLLFARVCVRFRRIALDPDRIKKIFLQSRFILLPDERFFLSQRPLDFILEVDSLKGAVLAHLTEKV